MLTSFSFLFKVQQWFLSLLSISHEANNHTDTNISAPRSYPSSCFFYFCIYYLKMFLWSNLSNISFGGSSQYSSDFQGSRELLTYYNFITYHKKLDFFKEKKILLSKLPREFLLALADLCYSISESLWVRFFHLTLNLSL